MGKIVVAGLGAGAMIAALALLVERSDIGLGDYTLSGSGAVIIPALLAPWAVYWGWTWVIARHGAALEMALFVLGLSLGVGIWNVGSILSGSTFVIPAALLAGLAYRLFSTRVPLNSWTLFAAGFIAAVLVVTYWIGLGILTGMCVAAARRDMARRVPIGIALLVLLVILGNLPYFPGVFGS